MKSVIFIAPPAGGKGTFSEYLVNNYGYEHLSTGELLRAKALESDDLAVMMKSGNLIPDEIMLNIIKEAINKLPSNKPFILDGVPRTLQQAKVLDIILDGLDYVVVYIDVNEDVLLDRVLGRCSCLKCHKTYNNRINEFKPKVDGICDICGSELLSRADDNEQTFKIRYQQYQTSTYPLIEYYKDLGRLKVISNNAVDQTSALSYLVGVLSD